MSDLHFQHKMWLNELQFFKHELSLFQERLEELAARNTDKEMKAEQEQFQNKFILQNEVIDILLHDIREHEQKLTDFVKEHPVAADHVHFNNHTDMVDRMETFHKLFSELKKDFHRYAAKWL